MHEYSGYRMPAEWETHQRTFLSWPVRTSLINKENHAQIIRAYAQVAQTIAAFEPVTVLVNSETEEEARALCGDDVSLLTLAHDDAWVRDNGPTFVRGAAGGLAGISWRFNAWGEKYTPYDLDDALAGALLARLGIPCIQAPFVLEGGSIHTDGAGTLLTTEQCLLNPNRNPSLSRGQLEGLLQAHLGVSQIIWLKRGVFGDETDGHVDNIACFAAPGVALLQVCRDPQDPNYVLTQENRDILGRAADARGRPLRVVEIEQPPARVEDGGRLALSYINFYLANGGLILPVFGGDAAETDRKAAETLSALFPERKIVPVDGMPLIREGGNVHCITQQMPAGIETSGRDER